MSRLLMSIALLALAASTAGATKGSKSSKVPKQPKTAKASKTPKASKGSRPPAPPGACIACGGTSGIKGRIEYLELEWSGAIPLTESEAANLVQGKSSIIAGTQKVAIVAPPGEKLGADTDLLLRGTEVSIHTSCSGAVWFGQEVVHETGVFIVTGFNVVTKSGERVTEDSCQVSSPPICVADGNDCPTCDVCSSGKKLGTLTFRYASSATLSVDQDQEGKAMVIGDVVNGVATVCCGRDGGSKKGGNNGLQSELPATNCEEAAVQDGDSVSVEIEGASTLCTVSSGTDTQEIVIHTSCSKSLAVGDRFGALTVSGFVSIAGDTEITSCPVCNLCGPSCVPTTQPLRDGNGLLIARGNYGVDPEDEVVPGFLFFDPNTFYDGEGATFQNDIEAQAATSGKSYSQKLQISMKFYCTASLIRTSSDTQLYWPECRDSLASVVQESDGGPGPWCGLPSKLGFSQPSSQFSAEIDGVKSCADGHLDPASFVSRHDNLQTREGKTGDQLVQEFADYLVDTVFPYAWLDTVLLQDGAEAESIAPTCADPSVTDPSQPGYPVLDGEYILNNPNSPGNLALSAAAGLRAVSNVKDGNGLTVNLANYEAPNGATAFCRFGATKLGVPTCPFASVDSGIEAIALNVVSVSEPRAQQKPKSKTIPSSFIIAIAAFSGFVVTILVAKQLLHKKRTPGLTIEELSAWDSEFITDGYSITLSPISDPGASPIAIV